MKYALLLAGVAAIAFAPFIDGIWRPTTDAAAYLSAARELYEQGRYPPGVFVRSPAYPLFIAPLLVFGDPPVLAIRAVNGLLFAASIGLTYWLMSRRLSAVWAAIGALAVTVNPVFVELFRPTLTEPFFVVLSLAALCVADRHFAARRADASQATRDDAAPSSSVSIFATGLTALLMSWAYLTRAIGASLWPIGLWAAYSAARRDVAARRGPRMILFVVLLLASPLAWELRQSRFSGPHTGTYVEQLLRFAPERDVRDASGPGLIAQRARQFGPARLTQLAATLFPPHVCWRLFNAPLSPIAPTAVGALIVAALLQRAIRHRDAAAVYALLSLAVLAVWPWDEGTRFVAPLVPIVWMSLLSLVAGPVHRLARAGKVNRVVFRAFAAMIIVCLAAPAGVASALAYRNIPAERAAACESDELMRSLAAWQTHAQRTHESLLLVLRPRHPAKGALLSAGYLSRRTVLDVHRRRGPIAESLDGGETAWDWLLVEGPLPPEPTLAPVRRIGAFHVYRRVRPLPVAWDGPAAHTPGD